MTIKQGNKSIPTLISEIKSLADQLAAASEYISDNELVVVTLAALNSDYNPFATSMRHRFPPITCIKLHNNLHSKEVVVSERNQALLTESNNKSFDVQMNAFRYFRRGNYHGYTGYNGGRSDYFNLSVSRTGGRFSSFGRGKSQFW